MIKEILSGIFSWSEYSEEKNMNFNGFLLISSRESVIIDTPLFQEKKATMLAKIAT